MTLDRVMLAMDVVDTLRHQRALVEAELDDDRRQRKFVTRVQAIYESQGIEVPAAIIEEGVQALREDRFVYEPPVRNFALRLAEIYVERGKWAKRASIVLLAGLMIWTAIALPLHYRDLGLIEGYQSLLVQTEANSQSLSIQADELDQQVEVAGNEEDSAAAAQLLANASESIRLGRAVLTELRPRIDEMPDSEQYIDDRLLTDERLRAISKQLKEADLALGVARGLLDAVEQLRSLQLRMAAAMRRLEGVSLSATETRAIDSAKSSIETAIAAGEGKAGEAALRTLTSRIDGIHAARQRESQIREKFASLATVLTDVTIEAAASRDLASLRSSIEASLSTGDWERAGQTLATLSALVAELDSAYELRIVSRRNDRSGVWRHPNNDRSVRNFYIIVEAIDSDGRRMKLPILSEEDQSTRRVRKFGIRVPESVYEQVKADKLDNGLIDNVLFGTKRRGARDAEYRFPVAGGHITKW